MSCRDGDMSKQVDLSHGQGGRVSSLRPLTTEATCIGARRTVAPQTAGGEAHLHRLYMRSQSNTGIIPILPMREGGSVPSTKPSTSNSQPTRKRILHSTIAAEDRRDYKTSLERHPQLKNSQIVNAGYASLRPALDDWSRIERLETCALGDNPTCAGCMSEISPIVKNDSRHGMRVRKAKFILVTRNGIDYRLIDMSPISNVKALKTELYKQTGFKDDCDIVGVHKIEFGQMHLCAPLDDDALEHELMTPLSAGKETKLLLRSGAGSRTVSPLSDTGATSVARPSMNEDGDEDGQNCATIRASLSSSRASSPQFESRSPLSDHSQISPSEEGLDGLFAISLQRSAETEPSILNRSIPNCQMDRRTGDHVLAPRTSSECDPWRYKPLPSLPVWACNRVVSETESCPNGWSPRPLAAELVEDHLDSSFPKGVLDWNVEPDNMTALVSSQAPLAQDAPSFYEGADSNDVERRDFATSVSVKSDPGAPCRTISIRNHIKTRYSDRKSQTTYGMERHVKNPNESLQALRTASSRRSTKMFDAKVEECKPTGSSNTRRQKSIVSLNPHLILWLRGRLIGKGTFGHVYLGMNITTGELLAVKEVKVRWESDTRELKKEIDMMKDLDHVNIVQYLGYERRQNSISIFLEYISGGSVGSCLRAYGKFEQRVASSLTRQTLCGLTYLHDAKILHRDLKADNILLDLNGVAKISDFGISKRVDGDVYNNNASNSMQGSIFWMAPEVVRARGKLRSNTAGPHVGYGAKADIWSLGCIVMEMLAGFRPWRGEELVSAMFKLSEQEQPPIPDDIIDHTARGFMERCFETDPTRRPEAREMLSLEFCRVDNDYVFASTELSERMHRARSRPRSP